MGNFLSTRSTVGISRKISLRIIQYIILYYSGPIRACNGTALLSRRAYFWTQSWTSPSCSLYLYCPWYSSDVSTAASVRNLVNANRHVSGTSEYHRRLGNFLSTRSTVGISRQISLRVIQYIILYYSDCVKLGTGAWIHTDIQCHRLVVPKRGKPAAFVQAWRQNIRGSVGRLSCVYLILFGYSCVSSEGF